MRDSWQSTKPRRAEWNWGRRVYVSVNGRGEIVMNADAFKAIREPANVALLYDPGKRRIGVKFPVSADANFFPVRRYGRERRMRIVRGGRLMKQFGVEVSGTIAFVNPDIENFKGSPMIVLPLDKGRAVRRKSSPDASIRALVAESDGSNSVG